MQQDYQHVRVLAYHMISPYLDKSVKGKSIDQLIPDIYDDQPAKVINLKERHKQRMALLERAGMLEPPKREKRGSE